MCSVHHKVVRPNMIFVLRAQAFGQMGIGGASYNIPPQELTYPNIATIFVGLRIGCIITNANEVRCASANYVGNFGIDFKPIVGL